METGLSAPDNTQYSSIVGQKPTGSATENWLNRIIQAFVSSSQSVDSILQTTSSDTLVSVGSQVGSPLQAATVNSIVHTPVCLTCSDVGETASPSVWKQAAFWLMGGTGSAAALSVRGAVVQDHTEVTATTQATAASGATPLLDLTGYTEVANSNVNFSPASNSALVINTPTSIDASS